jgi:hypothetical protein
MLPCTLNTLVPDLQEVLSELHKHIGDRKIKKTSKKTLES